MCWACLRQGYGAHAFRLAHTSCLEELAGVLVCVITRCGGVHIFGATKFNSRWRSLKRPARSFHARDRGEGGCVIYYRVQVAERGRASGAVRGCTPVSVQWRWCAAVAHKLPRWPNSWHDVSPCGSGLATAYACACVSVPVRRLCVRVWLTALVHVTALDARRSGYWGEG